MKKYIYWLLPISMTVVFAVWTILVKTVDITYNPVLNCYLGFSTFNTNINNWVITLNNSLYDKLSTILLIVALATVLSFGVVGLVQWIKRKSLKKVDNIIWILLGFYILIAIAFFIFEFVKVNYAPNSIAGDLKTSYPSSHVFVTCGALVGGLMVLFVLIKPSKLVKILSYAGVSVICILSIITRMMSGAHYFTDIVGGVLLSITLIAILWASIKSFIEKIPLTYKDI